MRLLKYIILFLTFMLSIRGLPMDLEDFMNQKYSRDATERQLILYSSIEYEYPDSHEYVTTAPDYVYDYTSDIPLTTEISNANSEENVSGGDSDTKDERDNSIMEASPVMGSAFGGIFGLLAGIAVLRHMSFKKTAAEMEQENENAQESVEMNEIEIDAQQK